MVSEESRHHLPQQLWTLVRQPLHQRKMVSAQHCRRNECHVRKHLEMHGVALRNRSHARPTGLERTKTKEYKQSDPRPLTGQLYNSSSTGNWQMQELRYTSWTSSKASASTAQKRSSKHGSHKKNNNTKRETEEKGPTQKKQVAVAATSQDRPTN